MKLIAALLGVIVAAGIAWWLWSPAASNLGDPIGSAPADVTAPAPLPDLPAALPRTELATEPATDPATEPVEVPPATAPAAPRPTPATPIPVTFEFGKRLGATVSGMVVDSHGRPAADIAVYSTQERGDGRGEWHWSPRGNRRFRDGGKPSDTTTSFVKSREDGTFELLREFLPDRPITLRLDPHFRSRWQAGPASQVTVNPASTGVVLSMIDKPTIRLRVIDAGTRRPIPAARAFVWGGSPFASEWAGDSLRIFLQPGGRQVMLRADGYQPATVLIQMPDPAKGEGASDGLWPETIALQAGLQLAGALVNADGTPVRREACIYLERCDPGVALDARPLRCTDPERDGSFDFGTLPPAPYRLVVIAAGYITFDLTAPLADLAANASITLERGTPRRAAAQPAHDWAARRHWPVPLDSWYAPLAERLRILETVAGVRITLEPGVYELLQKTPIYGLSTGAAPLATRMREIAKSLASETEVATEFDAERGVMRLVKK